MTTEQFWCHINYLKLLSIFLTLQSFLLHVCAQSVAILSENTTAVSYINHLEAQCPGVFTIWHFVFGLSNNLPHYPVSDLCPGITLSVTYVPGVQNENMNSLSKCSASIHKWELSDIFLHWIFQHSVWPDIDVFKTRQKFKCDIFCSRMGSGPLSLGDGLLFNWMGHFV